MRIGCLQFAPRLGDVPGNMARAEAILARTKPEERDAVDLLILPEMAFSGYNFKSAQELAPFLEVQGVGPSSSWARRVAATYKCFVAVGYPEKLTVDDDKNDKAKDAPMPVMMMTNDESSCQTAAPSRSSENYNSLVVVDSAGNVVANYRKTFLYYTDQTWATEGPGFFQDHLQNIGRTAMGICMDINPYKFEAPWTDFEFANHVVESQAQIVILSMAWLTHADAAQYTQTPDKVDVDTLSYWVGRMEPLIRAGQERGNGGGEEEGKQERETIVIFCNRCGVEDDVVYAGTSVVLGFGGSTGEVKVYGILGRGVESLMTVNTAADPMTFLSFGRPADQEGSRKYI